MKKKLLLFTQCTTTVAVLILFIFEIWVIAVNRLDDSDRESNLGNFPKNIAALKPKGAEDTIRFAVIGDTRSQGTFTKLTEDFKNQKLDFAVLLGDITFRGTPDEHRWFRSEVNSNPQLKLPLFYVMGNHDIDSRKYPVSLFEKEYGPAIFQFEYGNCLFVFLRIWNKYGRDYEDSLDFLRKLSRKDLSKYRKRLVFMHQPPPIPTLAPVAKFTQTNEFIDLFERMKIDYVFASDFHGYSWTRYGGIIYNITGGGGAKLVPTQPRQFHHGLLFEVGKDYVSQQFIVVNKHLSLEAYFERMAFTIIWPFYRKFPLISVLINLVFLGFLLVINRRILFRVYGLSKKRQTKESRA